MRSSSSLEASTPAPTTTTSTIAGQGQKRSRDDDDGDSYALLDFQSAAAASAQTIMMGLKEEEEASSAAVAALLGLSCTKAYLSLYDDDSDVTPPPPLAPLSITMMRQQEEGGDDLSVLRASKRPRKSALKVKVQQAPTPESVVPAQVEALMMDLSSNDVPPNRHGCFKDMSMRQVAMRQYAEREQEESSGSGALLLTTSSSLAERRRGRLLCFKEEQARLFWMAEAPMFVGATDAPESVGAVKEEASSTLVSSSTTTTDHEEVVVVVDEQGMAPFAARMVDALQNMLFQMPFLDVGSAPLRAGVRRELDKATMEGAASVSMKLSPHSSLQGGYRRVVVVELLRLAVGQAEDSVERCEARLEHLLAVTKGKAQVNVRLLAERRASMMTAWTVEDEEAYVEAMASRVPDALTQRYLRHRTCQCSDGVGMDVSKANLVALKKVVRALKNQQRTLLDVEEAASNRAAAAAAAVVVEEVDVPVSQQ